MNSAPDMLARFEEETLDRSAATDLLGLAGRILLYTGQDYPTFQETLFRAIALLEMTGKIPECEFRGETAKVYEEQKARCGSIRESTRRYLQILREAPEMPR